jgi:hypothetical protein
VLKISTAFSDACIHSFPHVWCNLVKSSCVTVTVHQTRYCRFVWLRRIEKCIPSLILASSVRTRCQAVFDNEHSLHLWKTHPCTSTVERQLMDRLQHDVTCVYSHSDIVCLLIQSNCIELQPSINILIWFATLFGHPVLIIGPICLFAVF